jgi:hypothetical protein
MENLMTSKTSQGQASPVRERWHKAALTALHLGHGANWAADITGLPLAFVYRVAREHGIPAARRVLYPAGPSFWEALMTARPKAAT